MRIVQYNAQVKDAPRMDPEQMVSDALKMNANVLTINAGGIAAWYPSKVPFHHINEYMADRDFLREILDAAHAKDIKIIARFDFSLAEDYIYHQNPQWFSRDSTGKPLTRGNDRPGLWRNLYVTCSNGGYQNEAVGVAVVSEVIENYDVDGIFYNASYTFPCWCEVCQEKYLSKYGQYLPQNPAEFDPGWIPSCNTGMTRKYWNLIRSKNKDMLCCRYYFPAFPHNPLGRADNINERAKTGNLLCTEAQDVLSLGRNNLPDWPLPAILMKMGRTLSDFPPPVGIIHMSPGMAWRHVGLPAAELLYWSAQVAAHGGQYWATLTGVCDTNTDKRMLGALSQINGMIKKIEEDMNGAVTAAKVLLLCDDKHMFGWTDALFRCHIEFDVMTDYQFDAGIIARYPVVIISKGFAYTPETGGHLEEYVSHGGHLIVEGTSGMALAAVLKLLGIEGTVVCSEDMGAAYLRIEEPGKYLREAVGETDLVPLRGKVGFCTAKKIPWSTPPGSRLSRRWMWWASRRNGQACPRLTHRCRCVLPAITARAGYFFCLMKPEN
jgi:hypothetical protein